MTLPSYAVSSPPHTALPLTRSGELFPVHRIYCVGRNYGKHVVEMGGDPSLQPPIFFMKPADAAVPDGGVVAYPSATADLHHEIELVTALKRGGADVAAEAALDLIFGFAAGVDLTRRDLQAEAKAQGQPWDAAKGFDQSAPIGAIRPKEDCGPLTGAITLSVNGAVKQSSRLTGMIWTVPEIISAVSRLWTLQPGDLIFTGTPDGVGPLLRGDRVHGEIEGVGCVDFTLA